MKGAHVTRIEIVHPSRPRVYVRLFDHDDAARRYAAGERLTELAAEYGVTREAVYKAVRRLRPGLRQKDNDSRRANRTTVCDRDVRAKGVHSVCRACNTRMKREWRQRTGRA